MYPKCAKHFRHGRFKAIQCFKPEMCLSTVILQRSAIKAAGYFLHTFPFRITSNWGFPGHSNRPRLRIGELSSGDIFCPVIHLSLLSSLVLYMYLNAALEPAYRRLVFQFFTFSFTAFLFFCHKKKPYLGIPIFYPPTLEPCYTLM